MADQNAPAAPNASPALVLPSGSTLVSHTVGDLNALSMGKAWPDIADTALHYAAGGCLLGLCAYLALHQALSQDLMATMIAGAAVAIGFKLKG